MKNFIKVAAAALVAVSGSASAYDHLSTSNQLMAELSAAQGVFAAKQAFGVSDSRYQAAKCEFKFNFYGAGCSSRLPTGTIRTIIADLPALIEAKVAEEAALSVHFSSTGGSLDTRGWYVDATVDRDGNGNPFSSAAAMHSYAAEQSAFSGADCFIASPPTAYSYPVVNRAGMRQWTTFVDTFTARIRCEFSYQAPSADTPTLPHIDRLKAGNERAYNEVVSSPLITPSMFREITAQFETAQQALEDLRAFGQAEHDRIVSFQNPRVYAPISDIRARVADAAQAWTQL